MKNIFKKIGFLCTALLALSLGTSVNKVEAAETTVAVKISDYASANSWTNETKYTSLAMDNNITVNVSGGGNTGKYYTNGNDWRIYQTETPKVNVTAAEGFFLSSVKFTYTFKNNGCLTYGGNNIASQALINNINNDKLELGVGNTGTETKGQVRITAIEVVYTSTGADVDPEPSVPETPVDTTDKVKDLFIEYNNGGTYIKETKLNVNSATMKEVAKYFHNKQDVRYRKTEYKPGELTMVTKESENADWDSNTSTYKDNGTGVDHLTNGVKDYSTSGIVNGENRNSVEDWFVTLNDFINSTSTGWTGNENDGYTYNLTATTATEEHEMTRLAREFVAPMWLAPNAENYNYATFTSLTVEEDGTSLIMKLYVSGSNDGVIIDADGDENTYEVFSQATIKLPVPDVFNFDFSNITSKGSEITSATALETFQEYLGQYKSILTSVETNKVYAGNGSGGAYENTPGLLKFGTSSATGSLKLIFDESTTFTTVEIVCRSWSTSEGTNFTVNGTTKAAPKTDKGTLVFTIAESNEISISAAKRGFIFSIKLS